VAKKEELYKWIKACGFISFIPFMLAAGPLCGFFIGSFLKKNLGLGDYIIFIFITIGFAAGFIETIKIIKRVTKI